MRIQISHWPSSNLGPERGRRMNKLLSRVGFVLVGTYAFVTIFVISLGIVAALYIIGIAAMAIIENATKAYEFHLRTRLIKSISANKGELR